MTQTATATCLIPGDCIAIYPTRYPAGWTACEYDYQGYASHGRWFADKAGARAWAKQLQKWYPRKRYIELK